MEKNPNPKKVNSILYAYFVGVVILNSWSPRGKRGNIRNGGMRGKSEEGLAARSLCQMRVRAASKCPFSHGKREVGNLEGILTAERR